MQTRLSPSVRAVGFWSAAAAAGLSLTYVVAQLGEWTGLLGSAGGAHSASTPLGIVVLLTPSLFLGPAFLLAMLAVDEAAPPGRRIWSRAAVAFATIYTALISINYYVQLTWVMPRLAAGRTAGIEVFLFTPFDSFLYAVDILGYSFMSVATLCAARVLCGPGLARVTRGFLIANGLVVPFIALQMYWHWFIWIAAAWAVTFPVAMWTLALLFRHAAVTAHDTVPARPRLAS